MISRVSVFLIYVMNMGNTAGNIIVQAWEALPSHLNSLILLCADVTVKCVLFAFLISIEQMVRLLV